MYQVSHTSLHLLLPGRMQMNSADSDVAVYKHPDEFPPDVQSLIDRAELDSVELSTHWYRNLVNTVYPGDSGVRFFVLRKQGRPIAALPVRATKTGFGQRVDSLSNYYTSIFSPVLDEGLKGTDLVPLINAVKAACTPLGNLRLAPMDPESYGFFTLLTALEVAGLIPFKFFCFGNWYLQAQVDWPTYLKSRSSTLRNTIKRMTKKLVADGGSLEVIHGGEDLARGLAAYESVYAASWKVAEPYPGFVPGLMQTCVDQDWLRLGVVWLEGEPIAAQLWIVAFGKASIYKVAYNEAFKAYAPGTMLSAMLMEHVIEKDHVTEVDFLIGDDPYKKTWMSHRRERWGIIAYNPRTWYGMIGLSREVASRTIKVVGRFLHRRTFNSKRTEDDG